MARLDATSEVGTTPAGIRGTTIMRPRNPSRSGTRSIMRSVVIADIWDMALTPYLGSGMLESGTQPMLGTPLTKPTATMPGAVGTTNTLDTAWRCFATSSGSRSC
jgi:hypothetical protein